MTVVDRARALLGGRRDRAVDLAAPRPVIPGELTLGEQPGEYGGTTGTYAAKIAGDLRPLLSGSKLTEKHVAAMRRHYHVAACLTVRALPIVRAEWSIECDDDDVREWLTSAYSRIALDLHRSASRALWAGYSPNGLTWDYLPEIGGVGVTAIRDLDPYTVRPLVDDAGAYAGMQQRDPQTREYGDPIGPLDTLWLVEGMESGNLYGRSILEAALEPWQDALGVRLFHARYLERFGEPVVKVRTPPGESLANGAEIAAAVAEGKTGADVPAPLFRSNVAEGRLIGESLRHHSVVSFPSAPMVGPEGKVLGYEWDLDYLEAKGGSGQDFREALRHHNTAMARACFVPDLLFTNSDTGAYALGQEHRSIFDAAVEGGLDDLSRQIDRHLIDRLVRWNFGDNAPRARLVFAGVTDEDRSELWQLAQALVAGERLPVEVEELAARLGIPLRAEDPAPVEEADLRREPGGSVRTEGPRFATPGPAERTALAASADPVAGLPDWKLPQSFDPPAYRRALTTRERRVPFGKIESELNAREAATIAAVSELLEASRAKVLRQVRGILGKPTRAEVLAAIDTLDLGPVGPQASAWDALLRDVWLIGLDSVRDELDETLGRDVPDRLGPEARAVARTYANAAAQGNMAALSTSLRLALLNAVTSDATRAGVEAIVSDAYDRELRSEGRPMRLTTRMLATKGLNEGRRDAIERGGIPLRGAQYSALLDRRTCDLCERLDEQVIAVEHPDLRRFTPPVHHNCRCLFVWITRDEVDFTPTWEGVPASTVDRFGSLVI